MMHQTSIFEAIAERERAFARIEKADPAGAWRDAAFAFVELFVMRHKGEEVTGETIVDAYSAAGLIPPGDQRWWGPVIRKAASRGLLCDTGRRAPRRKGHGTAGAILWLCRGRP